MTEHNSKTDNTMEHKNKKDIRLVPFTEEELENVQLTLLGKMMQLNRDANEGRIPFQAIDDELQALSHVTDKVSRYCEYSDLQIPSNKLR